MNLAKRRFWLDYWRLIQDPFSEEELAFATEGFEKLLVRYHPVEEIDQILADILEHKASIMRKRYYVLGSRGMGKSTLLNYVIWSISKRQAWKILPVYLSNVHVKEERDIPDHVRAEVRDAPSHETDIHKLRRNLCLRTIEALFDTILHGLVIPSECVDNALKTSLENRKFAYYEKRGKDKIDQFTAERLLRDLLHELRPHFDAFLFLLDELDKIRDPTIVPRFFRSIQGLLGELYTYGCVFFISGVPEIRDKLSQREYRGVSGYEIGLLPWSSGEARLLIESRLRYAMLTGDFPFSDNAVELICSKSEGRPRDIQRYARDALIWGAYRKIKKIETNFVEEHVWKEENVIRFMEDVRKDPSLEKGVALLKKTYHPDTDDPSWFFILRRIFELSRFFKPSASELREIHGIDMDISEFERIVRLLQDVGAVKKRSARHREYFVLDPSLHNLFEYASKTLGESIEYLPRITYSESPEVKKVDVEFSLRRQVCKILAMNTGIKFGRRRIAKEIIGNISAKHRAMKYYKVASERDLESKLLQGLPSVLRKLVDEGIISKLWIGRRNVYYWFEGPEMDFAKGIRLAKEVAKNVETAIKAMDSKDYSGAVTMMSRAIECSLRNIGEARGVKLPSTHKEDTLSPINDVLYKAKVYDRRLYSMIVSFAVQANPIRHRVEPSADQAKLLMEHGKLVLRDSYEFRKKK